MPTKKTKSTGGKRPAAKEAKEARQERACGFILPFAGDENYQLGRQFLDDPKGFLRRTNLRPSDLVCRGEVHAAIKRGEAFTDAVFALGGTATDIKMLAPVKELAAKHFGQDFEVAMIPYGLKFRERLKLTRGDDLTATGSGTITFCDKDVDVDG